MITPKVGQIWNNTKTGTKVRIVGVTSLDVIIYSYAGMQDCRWTTKHFLKDYKINKEQTLLSLKEDKEKLDMEKRELEKEQENLNKQKQDLNKEIENISQLEILTPVEAIKKIQEFIKENHTCGCVSYEGIQSIIDKVI